MLHRLPLVSWMVVAGVTWSLGCFYNVGYGGELSWLRRMYGQKMAIATQVQAPRRLLIVGGSGAHYSVDTQVMQQQLGMPVLNLGLDGPAGLDLLLASVEPVIRPGDVVLVIPEYLILQAEDGLGDRTTQFSWAIGRPELAANVPVQQRVQDTLMLGLPTLRGLAKSSLDLLQTGQLTGYYAGPLDQNGNPTILKHRSSTSSWWQLQVTEPMTDHAARAIAQFNQRLQQRGATLMLGLPWIYGSRDEKTVATIRQTAARLAQIAPLVYNTTDLNIKNDYTLFADTHYHLNRGGRQARSLELAQQLQAQLSRISPVRFRGRTPSEVGNPAI